MAIAVVEAFSAYLLTLIRGAAYKCFTPPANGSFICRVEVPIVIRFTARAFTVDENVLGNRFLFTASNALSATFQCSHLWRRSKHNIPMDRAPILRDDSAVLVLSFDYLVNKGTKYHATARAEQD